MLHHLFTRLIRFKVRCVLSAAELTNTGKVGLVSFSAVQPGLAVKHPDTLYQQTLKGSCASTTAGWGIKKLPFGKLFQPMSGNSPAPVITGPDAERPLRPRTCH